MVVVYLFAAHTASYGGDLLTTESLPGILIVILVVAQAWMLMAITHPTNATAHQTVAKQWPTPARLWPPNHKFISVQVEGVTDPDGDDLATISILSISQDEPVDGRGSGNTSPDGQIEGQQALIRSERSGWGDGHVYSITYSALDGKGGSCTGVVQVCVPQNEKKDCTDQGPQYSSNPGTPT